MKKIAILCAMSEELEPLKVLLCNEKIIRKNPWLVKQYTPINGCSIISSITKIGRSAAAAATASIIETENPDFIINIGSAGGLNGVDIKSTVISIEAAYADVNVTAFGYHIGQMAQQHPTFKSLKSVHILEMLKKQNPSIQEGVVCSADSFIANKNQASTIAAQYPNTMAIDMEFTAIAQTANAYAIPFIALKSISDTADGTTAIKDFQKNITTITETTLDNLNSLLTIIGGQSQ